MWVDMKKSRAKNIVDTVKKFGRESKLFADINVKRVSSKLDRAPLVVTVKRGNEEFYIDQVGIGVSQVVPIIVEALFHKDLKRGAVLLMEQPELHLHPVAQAALGEFFFDIKTEKLTYVLETHSDFLIDRFRAKIRETNDNDKEKGVILFCENLPNGNRITKITIEPDGSLTNAPKRFKKFFIGEIVRTMF